MFTTAILCHILRSENVFSSSDGLCDVHLINFRMNMGDGQWSAQDDMCSKVRPKAMLMFPA